jgi:hypothetical protein
MIAVMRFFTLALPFEVDGSPAPSRPARRQAFVQKCTFDRRAVGAVVVPIGLAFVVITILVVVISVTIPIMLFRCFLWPSFGVS